jgi:4-hydroxy-tetrahydrodipicolinate synthase
MSQEDLAGVFAPVLTPFTAKLDPDAPTFQRFCRWVLSQGSGLAIFGTNSEANSLSVAERLSLLDALLAAGLPPRRMMPGTGACALSDAVALCAAAARAKTAAVLMLPPFYYKDVPEDGLFAFYAETIERAGDADLRICLYHIPQVSGVAIALTLIERLIARYPKTMVGIKDSGGDFRHTKAMIDAFPGFRVFCGSERFLLDTMKAGGAGCISAMANINPAAIVNLYENWNSPGADKFQERLNAARGAFDGVTMIPALKRATADFGGCASFRNVRPPLMSTADADWERVKSRLNHLAFTMPQLDAMLAGKSGD